MPAEVWVYYIPPSVFSELEQLLLSMTGCGKKKLSNPVFYATDCLESSYLTAEDIQHSL